jgi:hypothetical protein
MNVNNMEKFSVLPVPEKNSGGNLHEYKQCGEVFRNLTYLQVHKRTHSEDVL